MYSCVSVHTFLMHLIRASRRQLLQFNNYLNFLFHSSRIVALYMVLLHLLAANACLYYVHTMNGSIVPFQNGTMEPFKYVFTLQKCITVLPIKMGVAVSRDVN